MKKFFPPPQFLSILICVLLIDAIVFCMAALIDPNVASSEVGLMERLQNLVLIAATAIFLVSAWRERGVARMGAFAAAIICIVGLLRELELPPTGPISSYLKDEAFRLHETIALAIVVVPYAALHRRHLPELLAYVKRLDAWPFVLAGLFIGIGTIFDELGQRLPYKGGWQFVEELSETSGYLVLLAIAVLFVLMSGPGKNNPC